MAVRHASGGHKGGERGSLTGWLFPGCDFRMDASALARSLRATDDGVRDSQEQG
ncbi:MAG: hypothetical protein KY456_09130 [Chloroflexi bacterium]|nr:hypothetical protein [Chloroflexota bacterium]